MNKVNLAALTLIALVLTPALNSCGPSVRLTASWRDPAIKPLQSAKILVLAIGNDLQKRKLAEDHLKSELQLHLFSAITSLDEFGPDFARAKDTLKMRGLLQDKQFDGVLTVRVLRIDERDRWAPGGLYYGPDGMYRGFYGYYDRVWGYYGPPGHIVTDVQVLLESNLYRVTTGELLWSGQSKAFSRDPTPEMASRYAANIVNDMIKKHVILP